jgi:hypothetical protein
MKMNLVYSSVTVFLLAAVISAGAEIIAGPVTNPANGHDYYLLAPQSWPAAEAEAENLGGTLAIIKNEAEHKWVFAQFGHDGDQERSLWLGLHRQWPGGPFVWMDGTKVDYANWDAGQPDNCGGNENCVNMRTDNHIGGLWNDAAEATVLCAVVEVPGKSSEKALTEKEKALIGNWYESGRPDRQAWIAATDNKLFLITHDRHAARLVLKARDVIYDADRQYGEIAKDKILWSNGTWWSRQPAKYAADQKVADKEVPRVSPGSLTD